MDVPTEYDRDFVGWTEHQAALLRALPSGVHGLDTAQLAEEIEDLGRTEIRAVSSLLRQTLVHLIKLSLEPEAQAAEHWIDEILTFQADAVVASSAGIRQRVDIQAVWFLAGKRARLRLASRDAKTAVLPKDCPFTLDELLSDEFDPVEYARKLRLALQTNER